MRPRHPRPVQGLVALPLPANVGEAPDGARQSRLGTVRLHSNFPCVKVSVLRSLQGLLQLALQQLVPPLQLMDFGEEAAEPQVERFQHMDVGAQVVTQGAGHRARPGVDVADGAGRNLGEEKRAHAGKRQLTIIQCNNQNLFLSVHVSSQPHFHSFILKMQTAKVTERGEAMGGPSLSLTPRY